MVTEKVGSRDSYGTELFEAHHGEPELVVALEDEDYLVALADAKRLEVVGGHVGIFLDVAEGESSFCYAVLCDPEHSELVGVLVSDDVYAVECEVELLACRNVDIDVDHCAVLIENAVQILCIYRIFEVSSINVGNVLCTHLL